MYNMCEPRNVRDTEKIMSTDSSNCVDRRNYEKVGRIYNEIVRRSNLLERETAVLKSLLQTEGDINYRISEGSRKVPDLLHAASIYPETLDLLLDYGADFIYKDNENTTVLHKAMQDALDHSRYRHELQLRLDFKRTIDSVLAAHVKFNNFSNPIDNNGISHFHAACITGNKLAVEFFLNNGVDANQAVNADSPFFPLDTPLHLAVKYIKSDVLEVLLSYGAKVNLKNADGLSPLQLFVERKTSIYLAKYNSFHCISSIFNKFRFNNDEDRLEDVDDFGICKLHVACLGDNQSLAKILLKEVKNINQPVHLDSRVCPGYTALHFAAFAEVRKFKLLLENGANIHAKNSEGQTPFDLCLKKYTADEIRSVLLSKEEWQKIILSDNQTKLLDVVCAMKNLREFISLLDRISSPLTMISVPRDSPLLTGYTLLHLAVIFAEKIDVERGYLLLQEDDIEIVAECLKRAADMSATDAEGSTALHLAFHIEKRQILEFMLNRVDNKTSNIADKNNLSHFHIACATGHYEATKHFLSSGVNIDSRMHSMFKWRVPMNPEDDESRYFFVCAGSTALHMSVARGSDKITKKLLKHGADVNAQDVNGFTPIHRLCDGTFTPTEEIVDLLLSAKNLKNSLTHCGFSHLHVACHFHHCSAIKNLLKCGADINETLIYRGSRSFEDYDQFYFLGYGNPRRPLSCLASYSGYTPLHFSISKGGHRVVKLLIEKNADLLIKNEKGDSPLRHLLSSVDLCEEYCNMFCKASVAQEPLEKEFGITKLHLACHLADDKLVKTLISSGANVNAKVYSDSPMWQGRTPLHLTVRKAFEKLEDKNTTNRLNGIFGLLLKHGADPLLVDNNNDTSFHMIKDSVYRNKLVQMTPIVSTLFEHLNSFNVNPTNYEGLSLFHIACLTLNVGAIEIFLQQGVDVNQAISHFSRNCPGSTPLHLVIKSLNHQSFGCDYATATLSTLIDLLLMNGANINATDALGDTPLHAILQPGLKIKRGLFIDKLISKGADTNATNVNGNSPVAICLEIDEPDWENVDVFLKHGCDINIYNSVTQYGYIHSWHITNIIQRQRILDINCIGRTVLHNIVCREPYYVHGYIELITTYGCDIDHQDNEGKTALHLAVFFGNVVAVMELLENGADINIIDKYGKTAFDCNRESQLDNHSSASSSDSDDDFALISVREIFVLHARKLRCIGQRLSEDNENLLFELDDFYGNFGKRKLKSFHGEMAEAKNIKIGRTSVTVYKFLMKADVNVIYMNMSEEERLEVDEFFKVISDPRLREIKGLMKSKYRHSIGRTKLIEPAESSFNELTNYKLAECCRYILKFLTNGDLKRLISSAT